MGADELGAVITTCREEADDQDDIPSALGRYPQFYLFVIANVAIVGCYATCGTHSICPGYMPFKILNSESANERRWKKRDQKMI